ncbi:hypothetical protein BVRB_6g152960 [Beta vulgaris subsp. vulgaris]|nr:hypothetical protein BVRB_6g152960 [Beta vulgaris subsp. vulgaris]
MGDDLSLSLTSCQSFSLSHHRCQPWPNLSKLTSFEHHGYKSRIFFFGIWGERIAWTFAPWFGPWGERPGDTFAPKIQKKIDFVGRWAMMEVAGGSRT